MCVKWSNETMLRHSKMNDETRALVERLAENLNSIEYGESADALEYLGFLVPDIGGMSGSEHYPFRPEVASSITTGVARAGLPLLHKYVMDLCRIGTGRFIDDSIVNSVEINRWDKNTLQIKISDNRSDSKRFTIKVKANSSGVNVEVYKTDQEGRYGDLRDEGYVIAWESEFKSYFRKLVQKVEMTEGESEMLEKEDADRHHKGRRQGWIETWSEVPVERFDIGCEGSNHYFCSVQHLFGITITNCWYEFREKAGVQPELDLF